MNNYPLRLGTKDCKYYVLKNLWTILEPCNWVGRKTKYVLNFFYDYDANIF